MSLLKSLRRIERAVVEIEEVAVAKVIEAEEMLKFMAEEMRDVLVVEDLETLALNLLLKRKRRDKAKVLKRKLA
jgi:hypothetical protein